MADAPTLTRAAIVQQLAIDGDCTGCVVLQALLLMGDAARAVADCPTPVGIAALERILDAMDWTAQG